jgi:hypothetical protein
MLEPTPSFVVFVSADSLQATYKLTSDVRFNVVAVFEPSLPAARLPDVCPSCFDLAIQRGIRLRLATSTPAASAQPSGSQSAVPLHIPTSD